MADKDHSFSNSMHGPLIGAVDQGTSSTRFFVFASKSGEVITYHQEEVKQLYPYEGWVEQDPVHILSTVFTCIEEALDNLKSLGIDALDIKAVGITNQRETTVVWDKITGKPLYNAIVWLDARTAGTVDALLNETPGKNKNALVEKCGLPISTYFSALKVRWLFDNVIEVKKAAELDRLMIGTIDSWLLWNLTGANNGGLHITDVSNASRTMLMNLRTLQWDAALCQFFKIPMKILPEIRSSSEIYGYMAVTPLQGVPISGLLGDQQAALVGQMCLTTGDAKNTYGTGCFLLKNTGTQIVFSEHGLLTTVAYQMGKNAHVIYALEGSVAIAGAAVQWLRDNFKIINSSAEIEALANTVKDSAGVYFVPAFCGLYAPYWRTDARGTICGLTQRTTSAHLARAILECVCFQTREILDSMQKDSGFPIKQLKVDGGMTINNTLMQLQADIAGIPVVRPSMIETTALGAAMAAGAADGVSLCDFSKLSPLTTDDFIPNILPEDRELKYERWCMAIKRSLGWEVPMEKRPGPVSPELEVYERVELELEIFAPTPQP